MAVGITVLLLLRAGDVWGVTLTVNADGGADYTRIQDAVNNASDGDIIQVGSGTYNENIKIEKNISIIGINGAQNTTIKGDPNNHTMQIINVTSMKISGINVTNATANLMAGIYVENSNNVNISDMRIFGNNFGIYFINSSNNNISRSIIQRNDIGIRIYSSRDNTIDYNNVSWNRRNIYLYLATQNHLNYNNITNAFYIIPYEGIYLDRSENNILSGNNISNNSRGIYIYLASKNVIEGASIQNNTDAGIYFYGDSHDNIVRDINIFHGCSLKLSMDPSVSFC